MTNACTRPMHLEIEDYKQTVRMLEEKLADERDRAWNEAIEAAAQSANDNFCTNAVLFGIRGLKK